MRLPPGKYYVGDPCYVFSESWQRLLDSVDYFVKGEIVEFDGYKLYAANVPSGNGLYQDQNDNEFASDSALIGAIPIELIENPAGEDDGTIIDAPNGLSVYEEGGTFYIGGIIIKTNLRDPDDFGDPYGPGEDKFF